DAGARGWHAVRVAEEGGDRGRGQQAGQGTAAGEQPGQPGGRGDTSDDRAAPRMHWRDRGPDQCGDVDQRGRRDPGVGLGGGVPGRGRGYVAWDGDGRGHPRLLVPTLSGRPTLRQPAERTPGTRRGPGDAKGPGPPSPETATPARNRSSAPQRRAVGPSRAGRLPGLLHKYPQACDESSRSPAEESC